MPGTIIKQGIGYLKIPTTLPKMSSNWQVEFQLQEVICTQKDVLKRTPEQKNPPKATLEAMPLAKNEYVQSSRRH